ncbi:hypothetical protein JCM11491_003724 [Sporobolomyces phaffii]
MLSRLKRRTASTSLPPDQDPPAVSRDREDDPPSPTASRRTSTHTTPSKQSVHSNRTLSPTRPHSHYAAPSMSRSSSYGSVLAAESGARVGQGSLSLDHLSPLDRSGPLTLVVQAPELIAETHLAHHDHDHDDGHGHGHDDGDDDLDDSTLATPVPGRPVELRTQSGTVIATAASLADSASALHGSTPMSRPRAYTTSEAIRSSRSRSPAPRSTTSSVSTILPSQSGLDALAKINSPTDEAASFTALGSRPHSNSVPTSPPSHSRPHSRSVSRPASRSPSFNAQVQARPDSRSLHPPTVSPTRSRRNTKSSGASSGIAGAIALSGVALASPSSQLRHPLGLARAGSQLPPPPLNGGTAAAPSAANPTTMHDQVAAPSSPALSATAGPGDPHSSASYVPSGGGGKRSAASSIHNGVTPVRSRDSIDSNMAPASLAPESRRESQVYSSPYLATTESQVNLVDEHAFLSMDQLGDFDDVVSQLGTGYAVASSKRNADFHALFKNISDDDYLIEDYGCALQREILIQGRLYISEHHLSFYANIFGWVTSLTIPFAEVCSIEKRMTAYVIPNAIQISTMHARHTFASFLSRDTTYDLVGNIWRMVHPVIPTSAGLPDHSPSGSDDEGAGPAAPSASTHGGGGGDDASASASGVDKESTSATGGAGREGRGMRKRLKGFRRPRGGTGESSNGGGGGVAKGTTADAGSSSSDPNGAGGTGDKKKGGGGARPGSPNGPGGGGGAGEKRHVHRATHDTCPTLKNLKETCMDTVFPSAPEKIYNLMFTSGFMKDFWTENQKLLDLQIGDWAPQASGSNLLARSFSYIKPLNGSIGPRQTKCLITDESAHVDFDDFVCVVTTTRTPDVPSGSAFAVKTRTSMTWAKGNSCRVVVTTGVEWTKSSFIKGIIEKSCIDGQKTYHTDLEKAMRSYITTHRNEFVEEGQSDGVGDDDDDEDDDDGQDDEADRRSPAGDDPAGSSHAAAHHRSSSSSWVTAISAALEPVVEVVSDQSAKTLAVAAVLVVLVVSNLWTLSSGRGTAASVRPDERRTPGTMAHYYGGGGASSRRPGGEVVDPRTPDQVASAVRDVLQDYFQQQIKHEPLPSTPPPAPPPPPSEDGGWQGEAEEIGKVLDQLEARIRGLRAQLLTEID